jgi:DNA (cytosine-5)-methyltransferase 1
MRPCESNFMDSEITVLDLFSGIGGFSLGLERAGPFRTVAFCERDIFCQAVLRKHWPGVPIYDDVRTILADTKRISGYERDPGSMAGKKREKAKRKSKTRGTATKFRDGSSDGRGIEFTDELGRIDLVCGGFPCQPWSQAGQQRGAEDDRDLWPAMASLIEKLRPKFVIGENVRGFVNEELGLERSLSNLESLGYQAVPFIVPACAVDAPHRRDRVWIVANADGGRQPGRGEREEQSHKTAPTGETVAHADDEGPQRRQEAGNAGGKRTRGNEHAQRCGDGEGPAWLPEPSVGRVAHGVPRRVDRLKALGNAVVPQVVEQIGRAIIQSNINA